MSRLQVAVVLSALAAIGCGLGAVLLDVPLPAASPSPQAEAKAEAMLAAVDAAAWARTGAVQWDFAGRHSHLWDRQRSLDRVQWGANEVLIDLHRQQGRAWVSGQEVSGEQAETLVASAWEKWCNDAFWLNPVVKIYDAGTERGLVGDDLLVRYASGGVTPGDAYLWHLDETGRPVSWRMWVSIIPLGGVATTWEDWQQLSTGAWVSTAHRWPLGLTVRMGHVRGAESLAELMPGADPFAPLSGS